MAEDTRKANNAPPNDAPVTDESLPQRRKSKHDFPKTQAGKMWEAFGNPAEPVNEMPGGAYNSAGGKPKEVTWRAAFEWKSGDAKRWYKAPCTRDALLVGIGGGAAVGGVTAIIGGLKSMGRAANFAVAGFVLLSMGQYGWCESRRKEEAKGMAAAVIGMKMLQEKRQREKEAEEAKAVAAAAEAERLKEGQRQKQKSSWSFW
ncbi:hypothetical protein GJ744_012363 [Endocarpon pusillum]|uniref:Cytochrome c oxidase assembly protein COX20, mitochondrial n=1 Tax=Endocarpon pusillum TaxID=364733 RepID=A0A8H7AF79_9EURO|nr:hypothetical protein GJ744_012363 [Endocarpon pusillum]